MLSHSSCAPYPVVRRWCPSRHRGSHDTEQDGGTFGDGIDKDCEVPVLTEEENTDPGSDTNSEDEETDPLVDDTLVDTENYIPVAPTQEQLTDVAFELNGKGRYSGILVDGAKFRYRIHRQVFNTVSIFLHQTVNSLTAVSVIATNLGQTLV
jgi:hypothetical protein